MKPSQIGLHSLDVVEIRNRLASGALRAVELVDSAIERIQELEPSIGAWAWMNADFARRQAVERDRYRASGRPIGPLHGLPVGIKDIIDIANVPTENGTPLDAGKTAEKDSWVCARLRQAGAVLMGKTVTTELAYYHPGKTKNPHDTTCTPGGSSSGSAAAVACSMVPLSIGTQTGGSIVRPASFCGVTGFKPTFGTIPRTGILPQSPSLDTVGVFAASPVGCALLADPLFGCDVADPSGQITPFPQLFNTASEKPPIPPVFAHVEMPGSGEMDSELASAMAELLDWLGDQVFSVGLPDVFNDAEMIRSRIHRAEMSRSFLPYQQRGEEQLGDITRAAIREGETILARDYLAALEWREVLYSGLSAIFERADAIICPATLGPALPGLESTGSPIFNGLWTFCGTPAVTVPILQSTAGLPMGVQIIGPRNGDARLLRSASWLFEAIETSAISEDAGT